ncbi:uncharacterized protein LOC141588640 [Silene latifolia]|uniref:uncharacterized protein LOC141588640 n=1 Tax=Silene latifolia TaxID=37657 RepID=UPI003D76D1C4
MYNAPANGLVEGFNKTHCNLLRKVVAKSKRGWHERIGEALWAYRTTYKTPTQSTPYALVYGVEAVLPLEIQISSLRIAIQEELTEDENDKLHLAELESLHSLRELRLQSLKASMVIKSLNGLQKASGPHTISNIALTVTSRNKQLDSLQNFEIFSRCLHSLYVFKKFQWSSDLLKAS